MNEATTPLDNWSVMAKIESVASYIDKYQWKTECIMAKNQTSFTSVKKLTSTVLRYKLPYSLKLNIASLLDERWSSQLQTQLVQLRKERLKKIEACTGFEPLTSAIPVQRSYQFSQQANWEQVVELVRYKPVKWWWWELWIYENHICELRGEELDEIWSSQL